MSARMRDVCQVGEQGMDFRLNNDHVVAFAQVLRVPLLLDVDGGLIFLDAFHQRNSDYELLWWLWSCDEMVLQR